MNGLYDAGDIERFQRWTAPLRMREEQLQEKAPEFSQGDCSACGDEEVLLARSEQEDEPLHCVCKECFLRGR